MWQTTSLPYTFLLPPFENAISRASHLIKIQKEKNGFTQKFFEVQKAFIISGSAPFPS